MFFLSGTEFLDPMARQRSTAQPVLAAKRKPQCPDTSSAAQAGNQESPNQEANASLRAFQMSRSLPCQESAWDNRGNPFVQILFFVFR